MCVTQFTGGELLRQTFLFYVGRFLQLFCFEGRMFIGILSRNYFGRENNFSRPVCTIDQHGLYPPGKRIYLPPSRDEPPCDQVMTPPSRCLNLSTGPGCHLVSVRERSLGSRQKTPLCRGVSVWGVFIRETPPLPSIRSTSGRYASY